MAGDINNADWKQSYVLSGRAFMLQFGTEDAPVASTGSIDDLLAMATVDVPSGTTMHREPVDVLSMWQVAAI
jgi:hypothetical protein